MRERLRGCPLILNLERAGRGVPDALGPTTLAMPAALSSTGSAGWVVPASVANNHARDLGDAALGNRARAGGRHQALRQGRIEDLGQFRLVALTDLDNTADPQAKDLGASARPHRPLAGRPPLFAFLHWGGNGRRCPARAACGRRRAAEKAVSLIVGAHPHRASRGSPLAGGEAQLAFSSATSFSTRPASAPRAPCWSAAAARHLLQPAGSIPNFYDRMQRAN
jgi:hypothetical protein